MINWPEELPLPLNVSVNHSQVTPVSKIKLAKGSPITLASMSINNYTCDVTWSFTQSQFRAFNMFYDLILNNGTNWFNINLGIGNTLSNVNFMGNPLQVVNNRDRIKVSSLLLIDYESYIL